MSGWDVGLQRKDGRDTDTKKRAEACVWLSLCVCVCVYVYVLTLALCFRFDLCSFVTTGVWCSFFFF